jgi:hypothetical protein
VVEVKQSYHVQLGENSRSQLLQPERPRPQPNGLTLASDLQHMAGPSTH